MPIVSAMLYTASLLKGMVPPGATGIRQPIDSMITPETPDVNPDGIARCYVWPATGPEKRRAMPRVKNIADQQAGQAGWKQIMHDLRIFLVWMDDPNDQNADVNFPLFIDWVMNVLRTSPNAAQFTDPDTGIPSNFANLGEVQSYDFVPPRYLEADMMRRYDAQVRCSLLELFQS